MHYHLIAENPESTVVSEYQPLFPREANYQSEADLEKAFIGQLQTQAYEYLHITTELGLIANLRRQLEILNGYQFTGTEWDQFFKSKIANQNNGIEEKTTIIQEDHIQLLSRDDGTVKNIYLIDKANIHNNRLQVINQYSVNPNQVNPVNPENQGSDLLRENRYDVTILVNGLPLVHVEIKKRGVDIKDEKVWNIDREKALAAPERISNIVTYIRGHFDQKTKRNSFYQLKDRRLAGFNSIFAVSSIEVAKIYYTEFQKQMTGLPSDKQLKIAAIYSFSANEGEDGIIDDENPEDTSKLDQSSRDFLDAAIKDYNKIFKTNFDTSGDKFQNYYKDVSQRVKDREIDLLIVVNMFLTGFDATTLNTLWVDKNLRLHGLLQAFSRTNRILNSIKTFGNIICFRNLEKATNESISLFGDKEAGGVVLLKTYDEYYNGYKNGDKEVTGYADLVNELLEKYQVGAPIIGEQAQKDFIKLYGAILKVKNILTSFDEFAGHELLTERDVQDYHSMYINLYNDFRGKNKGDNENINDDIVFEMELIKQVEINIDYILALIRKYHLGHLKDKEIVISIGKAIDSSVELRNKKELIEQFIESLTPATNVDDDWRSFVDEKKLEELERIINEENLDKDETYKFITNAFRDGFVQNTGTAISKVLPPVSRFSPTGERTKKRETVLEKLGAFFNKFWDISGGRFLKN
ncbi:MAG: type I restriction endonuclease [Bacteroidetes bacterium]|nr:type I restriction endonuclease [Bacteroidota bacterium]